MFEILVPTATKTHVLLEDAATAISRTYGTHPDFMWHGCRVALPITTFTIRFTPGRLVMRPFDAIFVPADSVIRGLRGGTFYV